MTAFVIEEGKTRVNVVVTGCRVTKGRQQAERNLEEVRRIVVRVVVVVQTLEAARGRAGEALAGLYATPIRFTASNTISPAAGTAVVTAAASATTAAKGSEGT